MANTPDAPNTNSIYAISRMPAGTEGERRALAGVLEQFISQAELVKWPRGLQYFENVSYLSGNHLTRFYYNADAGFGFHQFGNQDNKSFDQLVAKVADNKLIRPHESMVSMLTSMQPEGRIEPNSDLPEDIDAAELAKITLDLLWEKPLNMPAKTRYSASLASIAGTVACEVEYGSTNIPVERPQTKTRLVPNPLEDEGTEFRSTTDGSMPHDHIYRLGAKASEEDATGHVHKIRGGKMLAAGDDGHTHDIPGAFVEQEYESGKALEYRKDIQARIWSSFHIDVDPAATCADDMLWVVRSTFEDVDWIKDHFNVEGDDRFYPESLEHMSQDNATKHILYWWHKFQDVIESPQYYQHGGGLTPQSWTHTGGSAPNQVLFSVIDVRPSLDFPRGRTLVLAGGQLLYAGDARAWSERYPWRWHPYAFFGWFKVPGRFFHIPLMSQLVPLQKKINAIDSLVQANRQFLSLGQWLIPKHANMQSGQFSGIPGEQWEYTDAPGMRAPEKVMNVPLPQELLVERDQLEKSIEYIAASGVVGPEVAPSAARAGSLLDFLRQEKLRSKSPMLQEFQEYLEVTAQNILIEVQLNMHDGDEELTQRIRTAAREHSDFAVESFTGASLRDHHAVKMDIASALLKSPEAREAKAQEFLAARGQAATPQEVDAVMRVLGLDEFVRNQESMSIKRARRMIARIKAGQVEYALPMPGIDNVSSMAPVFQAEILSDSFHDLDEGVKNALLQMFTHYSEAAQAEAQQQLEMQIMMAQLGQGGGPAPQ